MLKYVHTMMINELQVLKTCFSVVLKFALFRLARAAWILDRSPLIDEVVRILMYIVLVIINLGRKQHNRLSKDIKKNCFTNFTVDE